MPRGVNFLKGGILHANRIITVSATYAQEILTPAFGFGLQDVVLRRQAHLDGILNGVDLDEWDAQKDKHLAKNFSAQDLAGKRACKLDLQKQFKLTDDPQAPLVGVISRLWDQKVSTSQCRLYRSSCAQVGCSSYYSAAATVGSNKNSGASPITSPDASVSGSGMTKRSRTALKPVATSS